MYSLKRTFLIFLFILYLSRDKERERNQGISSLLLLQDGCVFTFRGIAGFCQRLFLKAKGDSYAEI